MTPTTTIVDFAKSYIMCNRSIYNLLKNSIFWIGKWRVDVYKIEWKRIQDVTCLLTKDCNFMNLSLALMLKFFSDEASSPWIWTFKLSWFDKDIIIISFLPCDTFQWNLSISKLNIEWEKFVISVTFFESMQITQNQSQFLNQKNYNIILKKIYFFFYQSWVSILMGHTFFSKWFRYKIYNHW